MSKYSDIGEKVLACVGGKDNVSSFTHCVTRLRFILKDKSAYDEAAMKGIAGVLGTQWAGEQLQVVIGQTVEEVYDAMCELGDFKRMAGIDENLDADLEKKPFSIKDIPGNMLHALSGCIFPLIPILIPAGLMLLLGSVLGPNLLNLLPADHDLIVLFNFVGNAGMYFMPVFAAWSAAKYFNTSAPVAMFLGAVLIHPTLMQIVADQTPFTVYGIPMTPVTYSSQFLPSIVSVWIMSYVYGFLRKHMPESLRYAFLPLFTIMIMLPISLCVIGPLGSWMGNLIGAFAAWLAEVAGPIAIGLIGGLWYFLVALGMDKAIVPIVLQQFAQHGFDNLFWCSAVFGTYALLGVAVASVFTQRGEKRSMAVSNAVTLGVGGVSEPTIYTSLLPNKLNWVALFSGGFVGGVIGGLFSCKAWVLGTGNALFATVFAGGDGTSLMPGIIASAVAFGLSFAISLIGSRISQKKVIQKD